MIANTTVTPGLLPLRNTCQGQLISWEVPIEINELPLPKKISFMRCQDPLDSRS